MKKTQFIELLQTIKETIVSFISITMFVALSVGVFVGISWSSKAISESTTNALEARKARDIEILFPYGLDEADIDILAKQENVDEIVGSYTGYSFFEYEDATYQAKLFQIHDSIDLPLSIEGTLPKEFNEIGIDKTFANNYKIEIGDTIEFVSDVNNDEARALVKILDFDFDSDDFANLEDKSDNSMAYLKTNKFTVTAKMTSNDYLNTNPTTYGVALTNQLIVNCFVYLPKSAFDETSFAGYPQVIIRNNELSKYSTFSNEYKEKVKEFEEQLKECIDSLTSNKNKNIKTKISNIIDNAQDKLDNANIEIVNGEKQIAKGRKLLADGKVQLDALKTKLDDGEAQYGSAKEQLNTTNNLFKNFYDEFKSFKEAILSRIIDEEYVIENKEKIRNIIIEALNYIDEYGKDVPSEVIDSLNEILNYIDDEETLIEKIYELESKFDLIENIFSVIKNQLNDLGGELIQARTQLDDYWEQYNNATKEYNNKKKLFNTAQKELAEAKVQYEDGVDRLNQFVNQTSNIKESGYVTLSRSYNAGLIVCQTLSDMFSKLRFTMAALFICVGFLVCYSTISRIVNDEIINIGTKKALGLSENEIMRSYLSYTGVSIFIGCILGSILGYALVENILVKTVNRNIMCDLNLYFSFKDVLIICLIEITILLLVTYFACKSILKRNAVTLLGGQTSIVGKQRFYEKTLIWEKLSLITKTIINNFFNEKRRVISTIIGIAGATSLIVTALTLNDNILDSFNIQYSKYHHFDKIISFDENNDESIEGIEKILNDDNVPYAKIMYSRTYIETPDNDYVQAVLFVPENDDDFNKMMTMEPTHNNKNDVNKGLWITNSYDEYYKPKIDDTISIRNVVGTRANVVPSGYFINYLTNYHVVMDKQTYKTTFNEDIKSNAYIISTANINFDSIIDKISQYPGYIGYQDYYMLTNGSFSAFESLSKALVLVYVVLSIAMSFLVLLNLLVMFVNEKKRELIILMINGYYLKDAKRYIYSDTILLTIIGIIFGCIIGSIMGNAAVSSFESNVIHFLHRVDIKACLIGTIGTAVLTFINCFIALRKISKFKLTDVNKQ